MRNTRVKLVIFNMCKLGGVTSPLNKLYMRRILVLMLCYLCLCLSVVCLCVHVGVFVFVSTHNVLLTKSNEKKGR